VQKARKNADEACVPPASKALREAEEGYLDQCASHGDPAAAEVKCTNAINSGKYKGEELAHLYSDRSSLRQFSAPGGDGVVDDLSRAIAITPQASDLYYARGHAYVGRKEYAKAVADLTKAISLSDDLTYRRERAGANLKWGKADEAFAEMADLVRLNGEDVNAVATLPDLLLQRAQMFEEVGERDKAIADYRRVLTLEPQFKAVGMGPSFDIYAQMVKLSLKRLGVE
jgi:tetratricopeptide (TPR) repeat protein